MGRKLPRNGYKGNRAELMAAGYEDNFLESFIKKGKEYGGAVASREGLFLKKRDITAYLNAKGNYHPIEGE